jgi:diguanylate cyclase (GGDEF)-like protein/PAS domain S-box-containing protein
MAVGAVGIQARVDERMLLRALVGAPDPIVIIDTTGCLVWANRAAESFFGVSTATAAGMSGLELVHPDDLELAALSLTTVQGKETGAPIEVRLLGASGWRLVELIGAPLAGGPEGTLILSIRDLTDRRRFEVARDDVAKFRSLVHNAAMLTMLVSPTGEVESASGALTRLLGHDTELVEGRPLAELVDDADRPALAAALEAAAASPTGAGAATTVELHLLTRAGGEPLAFELAIVNLIDDPTVGGFVVSGHDLAVRKRIEAELLTTLSLLSATLESTTDGILVVDRTGSITTMNVKFADMWRIPDSFVTNRNDAAAISFVLEQLVDPDAFTAKVAELYAQPDAESHDILEFRDGRVFERYSKPQFVDGEIVGRVWSFRDVTERRHLEEQLAHQALHDSLTNLANQSLFRDRVEHALARRERSNDNVAVLFIDLDNFKAVNDSLGHAAGDAILIGVSQRIERCLRAADTAARLGGDEFVILIEYGNEQDVINVAERLLRALEATFPLGTAAVPIGASIGIAFADTPRMTCDQLLRNADLAMYTAKRRGRGRYEVFEADMHATAVQRLKIESELRLAIERDELTLHYQPIVEVSTGRIAAVEALARWEHPTRGLLGADMFISLAEETGLIGEVGRLVLSRASAQLRTWQDMGVGDELVMSVNLSARQLVEPNLAFDVAAILEASGVRAASLMLEITEGAMMGDTDAAITNLDALKALGVLLAVDDFGTGYSSLAYLNQFPIDILKVDKSFVDTIDGSPEDAALPHAIIRLAQTLNLTLIAEGVERESQRIRLCELECDLAQGYHLGYPADADATTALLRSHRGTPPA